MNNNNNILMKPPANNNTNTRIHHFKLVLLGDTAVGKSCLVVRFVRDEFFEFQEPTIGAAFLTQTVALDDTTIKFEIWYVIYLSSWNFLPWVNVECTPLTTISCFLCWCLLFKLLNNRDTAGQERYRSLAPMYYRGAAAAIVVYDITNPDSFTGAKSWVKELQRRGDPNVVIALAGNKADLESRRKVEYEEANAYAEESNILYLETSAKNANNVKALFIEIAKKLPKNPIQSDSNNNEAFPIMQPQQEKNQCC